MKIFEKGKTFQTQAYYGWTTEEQSLYGIKMGYKNSANILIEAALIKGKENDIAALDTLIFPIIFCFRHSIEISLKQIYYRTFGKIPNGGHNLITLFDIIDKEIINMFENPEILNMVKENKENFIKYKINKNDLLDIRRMLIELQKTETSDDSKADVYRYLINKEGKLYFTKSKTIDYLNLKEALNYIYDYLDYIYDMVSDYL